MPVIKAIAYNFITGKENNNDVNDIFNGSASITIDNTVFPLKLDLEVLLFVTIKLLHATSIH